MTPSLFEGGAVSLTATALAAARTNGDGTQPWSAAAAVQLSPGSVSSMPATPVTVMESSLRQPPFIIVPRRDILRQLSLGAALMTVPGLFAEELARTPRLTEGPFYPDKFPLDTDNDLLVLGDSLTPAVGDVTWLTGRVLNSRGEPVRNALVEIWQCDANGVYIHTRSFGGHERQDKNFQGYGRFLTGRTGEYVFRTIRPVPYSGRTAHIHAKVRQNQKELLTTQIFIKGFAGNERDNLWSNIRDPKARELVTVPFDPIKVSQGVTQLAANCDLILGITPEG